MSNTKINKNTRDKIEILIILALCCGMLLLEIFKVNYLENELHNRYLAKIIQNAIGFVAILLFFKRLDIKLFGLPQKWVYLIPCLIIAIDNFQWSSYLNGRMELVNGQPLDFLMYGAYCLSVGVFEECIFRGIIFSLLASYFPKDKTGLWKTYIMSSLFFGVAHLLNGFSFGTILQVGYTFLTGGLFAFTLLKTKNVLCCAFVHALYNFGGLLFEKADRMGLGNGVVFDFGTVITMLVVSVAVGLFVLYSVYKYSEGEQAELYKKLGVSMKKKEKSE